MKKQEFNNYKETIKKSLNMGKKVKVKFVDGTFFLLSAKSDPKTNIYIYEVYDSMFPTWKGEYMDVESILKEFYLPKVMSIEI